MFLLSQDMFEVGQKIIYKHSPIFRIWIGRLADINLTRPEHVEVSEFYLQVLVIN